MLEYGDISETSYIASCRKSVLGMLYGKYVADGTINLKSSLEDLGITDQGGLLEIEKTAQVIDLLTARSGIYHPASNGGDDSKAAPERGTKKPGEMFLYNNFDFNIACTVFEKCTKKDIYDSLQDELATPIGMSHFHRDRQRKLGDITKSVHLAYHMWLSTSDMARIGHLMLNKGNWNGKQVIPEQWVKELTTITSAYEEISSEKIKSEGLFSFGKMWWVWRDECFATRPWLEGAYAARGAFGQYIGVFPKINTVVAHKKSVDVEKVENSEASSKDAHLSGVSMAEFMQILDSLFAV